MNSWVPPWVSSGRGIITINSLELTLFNILRWELTPRKSDCPEEGIRMVAVLIRKLCKEVFTTYLPTILLTMTTNHPPFSSSYSLRCP